MSSNKYLLHYIYSDKNGVGEGSVTITQNEFRPITPKVIDDAVTIVRGLCGFDDTVKVAPVSWKRYEEDDDRIYTKLYADLDPAEVASAIDRMYGDDIGEIIKYLREYENAMGD